jgi:hypothetical protein
VWEAGGEPVGSLVSPPAEQPVTQPESRTTPSA